MTENQNMAPEEILRKHLEALENDTEGAYSSSEIDNYCLRAMREYGSQQFTAGVEAGKREREFIPDIEEPAIHQWDMHYGMGKDEQIKPYVIEDFKAGAEWMKNRIEQESKWIPVEERLPEHRVHVLADLGGWPSNTMCVVYYDQDTKEWWSLRSLEILTNVKHWQPLPSPPNPDKGGKEKDNG